MKILISVDTSESAGTVLTEAKSFIKGFPDAEVHVFTVIDMAMIASQTDYTDTVVMDTLEREANELFNLSSKILGDESFIFSKEIGSPVDGILEKAESIQCDLLIMGTHGRKGLNHLLIGSVAEKVVRMSNCNTLIIPIGNKAHK